MSHHSWVLLSYTFSKMLATADNFQTTGWSVMVNDISPYQRQRDKALAGMDVPQDLSLAFLYELPFGKGQRFLNQGRIFNKFLGGWSLTSIVHATSGTPFVFRSSNCNVPKQFAAQCIPAVIPGMNPFLQNPSSYDPSKGPLFNKAAFESASSFNFYLGDGPRVSNLRGPGYHNQDLTFMKETGITEKVMLQFRTEVFNIWNLHEFTTSGTNYGLNGAPGAFITDVASPSFGQWNGGVTPPRVIQFGMKLLF